MPQYTIRWTVDLDANSPLGAAQQALDIQRDSDSIATVFDVQLAELFAPDNWETIDLTPEKDPPGLNSWSVIDRSLGWQDCSRRLDFALVKALAEMDAAIAVGETVKIAALEAHERVNQIMLNPVNRAYGASDTEPRGYLVNMIRARIRDRYPDNEGDF